MSNLEKMLEEDFEVHDLKHLPIISHYVKKLGIVELLDQLVPSEMTVSVGDFVLAMVLDTLSGRTPLYRLEKFFEGQNIELLLGKKYKSTDFNDDNAGRMLDKIYKAGSMKLFTQCALKAAHKSDISFDVLRYDTTSRNVSGDYVQNKDSSAFSMKYGYSKDKRPDLKQFVIGALCIDKAVPVFASFEDGNASDKKLNYNVLSMLSKSLIKDEKKLKNAIYVADAALVSKENLEILKDTLFVTRLPANYKALEKVVEKAIHANNFKDVGVLAETPASSKQPRASYRVAEEEITLHSKKYRAIIVQSSTHDKRRMKRLENEKKKSLKETKAFIKKEATIEYACQKDASEAAKRIMKKTFPFHKIQAQVIQQVKYAKGRPSKTKPRQIKELNYVIETKIVEDSESIERKKLLLSCFVLLSNVPKSGEQAKKPSELLKIYKEQHGIERNFSFLKDPMIVNSLFLKNENRIEALGLILLISLLVWRLMERNMRKFIEKKKIELVGLDKKKTKRPTSYMITIHFMFVLVIKIGKRWRLAKPLTPIQKSYLAALDVPFDIFTKTIKTKTTETRG
jgi:transposase